MSAFVLAALISGDITPEIRFKLGSHCLADLRSYCYEVVVQHRITGGQWDNLYRLKKNDIHFNTEKLEREGHALFIRMRSPRQMISRPMAIAADEGKRYI
jgi:hypothetical protein